MDWAEITIVTTTAGAEAMSEVLMCAGSAGTVIEDKLDFEFHGNKDDWDYIDEALFLKYSDEVQVKGYLVQDSRLLDSLALIKSEVARIKDEANADFDIGSGEVRVAQINERDWANEWKKYYKPQHIGNRLVVKPTWESYEAKDDELVIELDPGMAFGTGTHETTRMCLVSIEKYVQEGMTAIDIGCGSAILGIAAAKMGAADVLAIDRDRVAVTVAGQNIALNSLCGVVRHVEGDLLKGQQSIKADVIIVNIIADVIITLLPGLRPYLKDGGVIITSGIIKDRCLNVMDAMAEGGYTVIEVISEGEWNAVICK